MPLDSTTYVEHDIIPDILRRARNLVVDNWVQCPDYTKASDGHCIVGAVGATLGSMQRERGRPVKGLFDAVLERLCAALPDEADAGEGGYSLAVYNDKPGRTLEEILNLFDAAMVGNGMPSLRQW